jgi:hypothetical protein
LYQSLSTFGCSETNREFQPPIGFDGSQIPAEKKPFDLSFLTDTFGVPHATPASMDKPSFSVESGSVTAIPRHSLSSRNFRSEHLQSEGTRFPQFTKTEANSQFQPPISFDGSQIPAEKKPFKFGFQRGTFGFGLDRGG